MARKLPPPVGLSVSLGVDRVARPLSKLCDRLDPLLDGKSTDALGLSSYQLSGDMSTMKHGLRTLENTFNSQLLLEKEARNSEAKSFQMARAAHAAELEKWKKLAAGESVGGFDEPQKLNISELLAQFEQQQFDVETVKLALVAAATQIDTLNAKLVEQAVHQRALEQKLQQRERDLDTAIKGCKQEQVSHQQDVAKIEAACKMQEIKMNKALQEAKSLEGKLQRQQRDLDTAVREREHAQECRLKDSELFQQAREALLSKIRKLLRATEETHLDTSTQTSFSFVNAPRFNQPTWAGLAEDRVEACTQTSFSFPKLF